MSTKKVVNKEVLRRMKTTIKVIEDVKEVRICSTTNAPHKNTSAPRKFLGGEFHNISGKKKETARERQAHAVNISVHSSTPILTLPHEKCLLEIELLKTDANRRFQSAEIHEDVFHKQLGTIIEKKLPISTYFGNVRDLVVKARENEYSHALLDFCCQFATIKDIIKTAMNNLIVEKGGVITLTVNKRISSDWDFYTNIEKLNPQKVEDEKTRVEHAVTTFINRNGGDNWAIEDIFNYHDTTSMLLIVIRRIN